MRIRFQSPRAVTLLLVLLLAATFVPLEVAPAEAGRIKFRVRSAPASKYTDRIDDAREQARAPVRIRIRSNSGSDSKPADGEDDKARPRQPGTAAAAATRARAALEAEAQRAAAAAVTVHQPVSIGKTTEYSNGVSCVAGC
jgi:hypothetical protein